MEGEADVVVLVGETEGVEDVGEVVGEMVQCALNREARSNR